MLPGVKHRVVQQADFDLSNNVSTANCGIAQIDQDEIARFEVMKGEWFPQSMKISAMIKNVPTTKSPQWIALEAKYWQNQFEFPEEIAIVYVLVNM